MTNTKKKIQYRSKFEERTAEFLKKKKIKFTYETERFDYLVPESKHYYKPDFILPNGIKIECKGKLDVAAKRKMELIKLQHPKEDIRILFMRDQPIRKGSNTYYSTWAEKTGYIYAFKEIPKEWL